MLLRKVKTYMRISTKKKLFITILAAVLVTAGILIAVFLLVGDSNRPDIIVINKGDYSNSEFWKVAFEDFVLLKTPIARPPAAGEGPVGRLKNYIRQL